MDARFDWDEHNIRHIARHGVTPEEFEQVLANRPLELNIGQRGGERRTTFIGVTDLGRILVAVATVRRGKARAVTAYPATPRLAALFQERR